MATRPATYKFSVDEYERMGRAGVIPPEERVELIEGEVVEMSPIGKEHAAVVDRIARLFMRRSQDRVQVRVQSPIRLEDSEPQPDVSLLRPRDDFYATGHPTPKDIFLLVEVADTTLEKDRDIKAPLYAAAGIPETWIVDLEGRQLLVCRAPVAAGYGEVKTLIRGERIAPAAFPGEEFGVEEVLGKV